MSRSSTSNTVAANNVDTQLVGTEQHRLNGDNEREGDLESSGETARQSIETSEVSSQSSNNEESSSGSDEVVSSFANAVQTILMAGAVRQLLQGVNERNTTSETTHGNLTSTGDDAGAERTNSVTTGSTNVANLSNNSDRVDFQQQPNRSSSAGPETSFMQRLLQQMMQQGDVEIDDNNVSVQIIGPFHPDNVSGVGRLFRYEDLFPANDDNADHQQQQQQQQDVSEDDASVSSDTMEQQQQRNRPSINNSSQSNLANAYQRRSRHWSSSLAANQAPNSASHGNRLYRWGGGVEINCNHGSQIYERPSQVPIEICDRCNSIVLPETAQSVTARAMPLPHSMRRDDRWKRLLRLNSEHVRSLVSIERLIHDNERVLLDLHEWRDAFSSDKTAAAIDYQAQNSLVYIELERSIKKLANLTSGFRQTIVAMLDEHRSRLLRDIRQSVPLTKAQFVLNTKRAIQRARPNALLYPTAGAICSICQEQPVNVRLHQTVQRTERSTTCCLAAAASSRSSRKRKVQPCTCHTFSACVDCLLTWYWEQSEGLTKSFATCPACRAEFILEDIVPVFSAATTATTTTN